jgi:hypothetical protein
MLMKLTPNVCQTYWRTNDKSIGRQKPICYSWEGLCIESVIRDQNGRFKFILYGRGYVKTVIVITNLDYSGKTT